MCQEGAWVEIRELLGVVSIGCTHSIAGRVFFVHHAFLLSCDVTVLSSFCVLSLSFLLTHQTLIPVSNSLTFSNSHYAVCLPFPASLSLSLVPCHRLYLFPAAHLFLFLPQPLAPPTSLKARMLFPSAGNAQQQCRRVCTRPNLMSIAMVCCCGNCLAPVPRRMET